MGRKVYIIIVVYTVTLEISSFLPTTNITFNENENENEIEYIEH